VIGCYCGGYDNDTWQETGQQYRDQKAGENGAMDYKNAEWEVIGGQKKKQWWRDDFLAGTYIEWLMPTEQRTCQAYVYLPDWAVLADDTGWACVTATWVNSYMVGSVVHSSAQQLGPTWWRVTWVVRDMTGNPFPYEISSCLIASEQDSTWTTPPKCFGYFNDKKVWSGDKTPNPYFVDNYQWSGVCQPGTPCAQGNPWPMLRFNQVMRAWNTCAEQYKVTKNVTVDYWCGHIVWNFP